MVTDEDLATDEEYEALVQEVREECAKYGTLLDVQIPRRPTAFIEPTAIRQIFLAYASLAEAVTAQHELSGRQFGPNVVEARFYPEHDFEAGRLR
jgi:splicing factor U2AF 65 kDa subunit